MPLRLQQMHLKNYKCNQRLLTTSCVLMARLWLSTGFNFVPHFLLQGHRFFPNLIKQTYFQVLTISCSLLSLFSGVSLPRKTARLGSRSASGEIKDQNITSCNIIWTESSNKNKNKDKFSWKEPEDPSNADHVKASDDALMFDIGWFAQVDISFNWGSLVFVFVFVFVFIFVFCSQSLHRTTLPWCARKSTPKAPLRVFLNQGHHHHHLFYHFHHVQRKN